MKLTKEFFEDIKKVRENKEDAEEALERLVHSDFFSQVSVFHGGRWGTLRTVVETRERGILLNGKDKWYELLRPELFLAIMEIDEEKWAELWKPLECDRYDSRLYWYLINHLIRGIERDLLNGTTLGQELRRDEQEWPDGERIDGAGDDLDTYIPESMIAQDNTEKKALNRIFLREIKEYLDDEEWRILTGEYGEDRKLAETLGIKVDALRKRRERIRKRVKILFEKMS